MTIRNAQYKTRSNSSYTTHKTYTATVVADITVPGNTVNPSWRKPIRMITVKFDNNAMSTYLSEEAIPLRVGEVITTHNSKNADGYKFISLRDIVKG